MNTLLDGIRVYCAGIESYPPSALQKWQKQIRRELHANLQLRIETVSNGEFNPDWGQNDATPSLVVGRMHFIMKQCDVVVLPIIVPLTSTTITEVVTGLMLNKVILGWGLPPIESLTNDPHDLFWLAHCVEITNNWKQIASRIRALVLQLESTPVLEHSLRHQVETYQRDYLPSDSYALQLATHG